MQMHPALKPMNEAPLPVRVDRRGAAELLGRLYFPASPRSLERWPLTWRRVNGKAVCETAELFKVAQAMLDAAPPIRGGDRRATQPMREAA